MVDGVVTWSFFYQAFLFLSDCRHLSFNQRPCRMLLMVFLRLRHIVTPNADKTLIKNSRTYSWPSKRLSLKITSIKQTFLTLMTLKLTLRWFFDLFEFTISKTSFILFHICIFCLWLLFTMIDYLCYFVENGLIVGLREFYVEIFNDLNSMSIGILLNIFQFVEDIFSFI